MALNRCNFCRKAYLYQNKIVYDEQGNPLGCEHDGSFIATQPELDVYKEQRVKYAKDIVQPFRVDGTVNPDFKKLYPNRKLSNFT